MDPYEKALALWRSKRITTAAELAEALNGHSIAFAYHSGKIENEQITYNDTREIFEHDGVTSYTGDLRTLFEIRNAKDANELFLEAFEDKCPWPPAHYYPRGGPKGILRGSGGMGYCPAVGAAHCVPERADSQDLGKTG